MRTKPVTLTVQRWGNSLAVRIPAAIARRAHFELGTPIEIALQDVGVTIKPMGERQLTLNERLAIFDPKIHGQEVMVSGLMGQERFE